MRMREVIKYFRDNENLSVSTMKLELVKENQKYLANLGFAKFGKDVLVIEFDNKEDMHIGDVYRYDEFQDDEVLMNSFAKSYIEEAKEHGLTLVRMIFHTEKDDIIFED